MPLVKNTVSCEVLHQSGRGCSDRKILCTGRAAATDEDKAVARKLAREAAEDQKKSAVQQAEQTGCPQRGCKTGQACKQRGRWRTGDHAFGGERDVARLENGDWYVGYTSYVEKRLRCDCVGA